MWKRFFKSQDYNRPIYQLTPLPIYQTDEFDFYRCLEFNEAFYGKTVSELHAGNLRVSVNSRYSKLFPGQKLSYWANSRKTAMAEVKKHGASNDILTFWAYDDTSSFKPTVADLENLIIIDGRKCGIQELIDKVDNDEQISEKERNLLDKIMSYNPDCLAFDSHAIANGENFIFFEKGFNKLSIREVRLRLGNKCKRYADIVCANTSDYIPYIESYGDYFAPILKVKRNCAYLLCEEYKNRKIQQEINFTEKNRS